MRTYIEHLGCFLFALAKTPMGLHVLEKQNFSHVPGRQHVIQSKTISRLPPPSHCQWLRAAQTAEPEAWAWNLRTKVLYTSGWHDLQKWSLELLQPCLLSWQGPIWGGRQHMEEGRARKQPGICVGALITSQTSGSNCTWRLPHSSQVFSHGGQLILPIV